MERIKKYTMQKELIPIDEQFKAENWPGLFDGVDNA
jgi:hypothetical protein